MHLTSGDAVAAPLTPMDLARIASIDEQVWDLPPSSCSIWSVGTPRNPPTRARTPGSRGTGTLTLAYPPTYSRFPVTTMVYRRANYHLATLDENHRTRARRGNARDESGRAATKRRSFCITSRPSAAVD